MISLAQMSLFFCFLAAGIGIGIAFIRSDSMLVKVVSSMFFPIFILIALFSISFIFVDHDSGEPYLAWFLVAIILISIQIVPVSLASFFITHFIISNKQEKIRLKLLKQIEKMEEKERANNKRLTNHSS